MRGIDPTIARQSWWRGMKERAGAKSVIFVVDDDASLRDALKSLFRSVGLQVEAFGSAQEFLQSKLPDAPVV
jgi:FixJ family two-component response regulator